MRQKNTNIARHITPIRGPSNTRIAIAAALLYDDRLLDEEIAQLLGVTRRTLARWKHRHDYHVAYLALSTWYRIDLVRTHHKMTTRDVVKLLLTSEVRRANRTDESVT